MISVEKALSTIREHTPQPLTEVLSIEKAVGRVLAEDVVSDIAMPPFDRSAVDGFALRGLHSDYQLMHEIPAGVQPPPLRDDGYAAPIMTGAPVPEGADRIVMVEHTEVAGSRLGVGKMPSKGANICWRAEDIVEGQSVLRDGTLVTPADTGIAAMAGRETLRVFRKPAISVLTTGSEVIPAVHVPRPGQVRNANGVLISTFFASVGSEPVKVFHSADDPASLRNAARQALDVSDILVTAGGVSMGTHDYVPSVLESLGCRFHFRTVAQKPGKPFSFATCQEEKKKMIFGLPGNPVSVLVCLEMYVYPVLRLYSGYKHNTKMTLTGNLSVDLKKKQGRQYFFRAKTSYGNGRWVVDVPPTSGSGDLMSVRGTNSIAWLPPQNSGADSGSEIRFSLMSWAGGENFWI